MKNPEFRERLELLIGDEAPFGWAERLGISKGAFTRIWHEGTMPKVEHLQKIKAHTGASLDWMIDGEGMPPDSVVGVVELQAKMSLAYIEGNFDKADALKVEIKEKRVEYTGSHSAAGAVAPLMNDDFALVPRHDVVVSGGSGATIVSEQIVDYFAFNKVWLRKHGLNEKDLVLVEVTGRSMEPVLIKGDTVLVDMSGTELRTGSAYVLRIGEELVVKYVQRLPGDILQLSSENRENFPAFEIQLDKMGDEIAVIGRVVSSSRNW